jgi:glutamine---fructose-6-phosphate transaminase (isomerizing)
MCGIVGIIGTRPAAQRLLDGLKRLEYRGYDSAGIAILENGQLERRRASGKLSNLIAVVDASPLSGSIGIGHTRWASHGAPTVENAHPVVAGSVAVVHNGIIENFLELKREIESRGKTFETETDTEVVAQLLALEIDGGASPQQAVGTVLPRLEGAFGLAILFDGNTQVLIGARKGSPLAVGRGEGEMYLGSDAIALAALTNQVIFLEDGDWVVLSHDTHEIFDLSGAPVRRSWQQTSASAAMIDKGNHRHFMVKEIFEQPEVIGHTFANYIDLASRTIKPDVFELDFTDLARLTISACGTAFYAGMAAKYWFEKYARLPVDVDIASEFRYREAPLPELGLAMFISQSGETADTLAALQYCKENGQKIASIVNVQESTIARASDVVIPIFAGTEVGVASTKAFTCQLTVLACLAIAAGRARGHLSLQQENELVSALIGVPRHVADITSRSTEINTVAKRISTASDILFLGRGINYPIALEGALKLKEISYIHAEGYAAGELKHGPIALVDEDVPVIIVAPRDNLFEKTVSNMQEVAARGGRIIMITDADEREGIGTELFDLIHVPRADAFINPLLYAIPVQLLAYHTAVLLGTDVDQPRNLAKSVTIE